MPEPRMNGSKNHPRHNKNAPNDYKLPILVGERAKKTRKNELHETNSNNNEQNAKNDSNEIESYSKRQHSGRTKRRMERCTGERARASERHKKNRILIHKQNRILLQLMQMKYSNYAGYKQFLCTASDDDSPPTPLRGRPMLRSFKANTCSFLRFCLLLSCLSGLFYLKRVTRLIVCSLFVRLASFLPFSTRQRVDSQSAYFCRMPSTLGISIERQYRAQQQQQ